MAGYARHANFSAVQVVGLGCEANQINACWRSSSLREGDTLRVFTIQEKGGTRQDGRARASRASRRSCPRPTA